MHLIKKIEHFQDLFNVNSEYTKFKFNQTPTPDVLIVFIDLAPEFNITKKYLPIVNEFKRKLFKLYHADYNLYYTYIYQHLLTNKVSVDNEEESYNNIIRIIEEIEYIINNILPKVDKILVIFVGKYKEYTYLTKIIKPLIINGGKKIYTAHMKYYSNFFKDDSDDVLEKMLEHISGVITKNLDNLCKL